jgi:hypothetical protein
MSGAGLTSLLREHASACGVPGAVLGIRVEGMTAIAVALPIDDRTFLVDAAGEDWPTLTFGGFDEAGRPGVLYRTLWGLPRTYGVSLEAP